MGSVMRDARSRGAVQRTTSTFGSSSPSAPTVSLASDQAAVAAYIADMTAQLETMAIAARLDLLAYFLAMARSEGESSARAATPLAVQDDRLMVQRPCVENEPSVSPSRKRGPDRRRRHLKPIAPPAPWMPPLRGYDTRGSPNSDRRARVRRHERDAIAAMMLEAPRQLQFDQHGADVARRKVGGAREIVD
jgi:hypothetical protein